MEKMSFKQYLASKEALREAVKKTPKQSNSYTVARYCNFVIGENKEERQSINLKPNQTITIDWLYEDVDNPSAINVMFEGVKDIDPVEEMTPMWTDQKIQKWLIRNTEQLPK